jgi:hypothetical protein
MALLRKPSLKPAEPPSPNCVPNYDDVLWRTAQQKTLATEMVKRARQMINSAASMRNKRRSVILP